MPLDPEKKAKLEGLIQPLMQDLGVELVELSLHGTGGRPSLVVTLDAPGGIGLGQLQTASKRISPLLDAEDPFPFEYQLEVSSPGIFRQLTRPQDFARFQGSRIKAKVHQEGYETLQGELLGLDEAGRMGIKTPEQERWFTPEELVKVNLDPEL